MRSPGARPLLTVLLIIALLASPVAGSADISEPLSIGPDTALVGAGTNQALSNHTTNGTNPNTTVSVGVGQQLSSIISTTSDDTQTGFENFAFEVSVEDGNESARAEAIADRAEELRDRAAAIRTDYRTATEAFAAGNLSRSQYAQRLATLNARAENVLSSLASLQARAGNVSTLELRAAGVNRSRLQAAAADLNNVTGTGPSALLQRFIGTTTGEIELETTNGLSIEVEGEAGERSRELRRPRDTDPNITVSGASALTTARSALSAQPGQWRLLKASVHPDEGYYQFEFGFHTANETGEAEVRVDGSSGDVFRIEEEIEPVEDEETERDELENETDDDEVENETDLEENESDDDPDEAADTEIDDVAVVLASGTPEPGANVTVQVLVDGAARANVTVRLNGQPVGTTAADGQVSLTLPDSKAKITASAGGEDGELEFEFEEDDDDEVFRNLDVSVSLDNRTATVTVAFNGSPVSNANVYANDDLAGKTPENGTLTFTVGTDADELELEVVKGEFEAEMTFELTDGQATQTEGAHEGDGDKIEDEAEEDDADEDEDREEAETPESEEDDDEDEAETDTPEPEDDDEDEEETDTPEPEDDDDDEAETDTPEPEEEDDDEDDQETDTPEPDDEEDDDSSDSDSTDDDTDDSDSDSGSSDDADSSGSDDDEDTGSSDSDSDDDEDSDDSSGSDDDDDEDSDDSDDDS